MIRLVFKLLCVFCTRQERRATLAALYEKGRKSQQLLGVARKWHERKDRLTPGAKVSR